jgi:CxxC motif-containing protein (DUF1111 family)
MSHVLPGGFLMSPIRMSRGCTSLLATVALAGLFPGVALASESDQDRLAQGRELFMREWVPGDSRSHGGDGLGPLYNETSCVACHSLGGPGGAGSMSKNVDIVTLLGGRVVTPSGVALTGAKLEEFHPGFKASPSVMLHRFGTDDQYRIWRLRRVAGVEFADMVEQGGLQEMELVRELLGLRPGDPRADAFSAVRPRARGSNRAKGTVLLSTVSTLTRRNAPALFGAGLIDSILAGDIRAAAARPIPQFPETRGRPAVFKDGRVGRLGWKSQTSSLKEFVESACAMELGLEVPTHHQARPPLDFTNKENGLDLNQDECNSLTSFVSKLPAPIERVSPRTKEPINSVVGRKLFEKVGCTACHVPKLGSVEGIYSDLLLHDMGTDLADSGSYYGSIESPSADGAKSQEWRTPPLWGCRDSGPYLHDGRADTLEEAIALHGGQGEKSAQTYFQLKMPERFQIQSFLNSLAAPPERGQ